MFFETFQLTHIKKKINFVTIKTKVFKYLTFAEIADTSCHLIRRRIFFISHQHLKPQKDITP